MCYYHCALWRYTNMTLIIYNLWRSPYLIRGYDVGPTKSVRLASHILTSGRVINKWRSDYRIQKGVHVESFLQLQNTLMTNSRIHLHKERGMYIARCRFMYDRVSIWQSSRHLRSDARTRGVYVVLQWWRAFDWYNEALPIVRDCWESAERLKPSLRNCC